MIDELREQVTGLQERLGRLYDQLKEPGAKRLKGVPLAKLVVSLDQIGTKLRKAAGNGQG